MLHWLFPENICTPRKRFCKSRGWGLTGLDFQRVVGVFYANITYLHCLTLFNIEYNYLSHIPNEYNKSHFPHVFYLLMCIMYTFEFPHCIAVAQQKHGRPQVGICDHIIGSHLFNFQLENATQSRNPVPT